MSVPKPQQQPIKVPPKPAQQPATKPAAATGEVSGVPNDGSLVVSNWQLRLAAFRPPSL